MGRRKDPSSGTRKSKAVQEIDNHLDEDVYVWQGSSFSSIASSVTAPPSQTASFYKKVLGSYGDDSFEYESSYGGSTVDDGASNDGSRHSGDGSESRKKDKKKKRGLKKGMRKLFGGTIKESAEEEEDDGPQQQRRPRRLSLFGGNSAQSIDLKSVSSDDILQSDDDDVLGSKYSDDLGYEDAAPTTAKQQEGTGRKTRRRNSLGGIFSKKEEITTQENDLGYEDAAPSFASNTVRKPKRRSSLGGMFSRKDEIPNQENDLGYGDGAPAVASSRQKPKRRGSLGGMFGKKDEIPPDQGNGEPKPAGKVKRRGSLGSMFAKKDEIPTENGDAAKVPRTKTKRRSSLGGIFSKKEQVPSSEDYYREASQKSDGRSNRSRSSGRIDASTRSHSTNGSMDESEASMSQDSLPVNSLADLTIETEKTSKAAGRASKSRRRHNGASGGASGSSSVSHKKEIHWIVNRERNARGMEAYERSPMLDSMAKGMANELAKGNRPTPSEYYGNVGRGDTLKNIHSTIMSDRAGISRKNILSTKFSQLGMALSRCPDGNFFMVQLFSK